MSINRVLRQFPCPCGSGQFKRPLYDARAIFITYVCDRCERKIKSQYRPEIFTDSNYVTNEPIEQEGT